MSGDELPQEVLHLLARVKGKRARIVVDHILNHGFISTEDLETLYGYKHPPRAIRDVRDQGIPLVTFSIKNATGLTIAAYRFGDFSQIQAHRSSGRRTFSKAFKNTLIAQYESKCTICLQEYEGRYLQIDHRVPYQITGDAEQQELLENYMLLCRSCNRAKSWSCEHCLNGIEIKNPDLCKTCYWANPSDYEHIALVPERRLDIVWHDQETTLYDRLKRLALLQNLNLPDYLKMILSDYLARNDETAGLKKGKS